MITEKQFRAAKRGDIFVDSLGRKWIVSKRLVSSFLAVVAKLEEVKKVLYCFGGKIKDVGFDVVEELNHPNAFFVKQP